MKYIETSSDSVKSSFLKLLQSYAGDGGFLDVHRIKIYGYIKLSHLAGRQETNGIREKGTMNISLVPQDILNQHFLAGMKERLKVLDKLGISIRKQNQHSQGSV